MSKDYLTDEQVEMEIERLLESEEVQLAKKEIERLLESEEVQLAKKEVRIKYKRRQYLYQLRSMEKRGKKLMEDGITSENIEKMLFGEYSEVID